MINNENIVGYQVSTLERIQCINLITTWIRTGLKNKYFVCANPHSLHITESDSYFKKAIMEADLVTPDGTGIVLASKLLKGKIKNKVSGSGIFRELSKQLDDEGGYTYFFLGSTDETLVMLKEKMSEKYPNIRIVGTYSPPFKSQFSAEDHKKMIHAINTAKPDVLWVGMTAPKQEKWICQNKDYLEGVKFIGPIGAVFDFFTGNVKRSHPIFLKMGLEWFPRLIKQPGRLWGRMFVSAPIFILRVLKQKIRMD